MQEFTFLLPFIDVLRLSSSDQPFPFDLFIFVFRALLGQSSLGSRTLGTLAFEACDVVIFLGDTTKLPVAFDVHGIWGAEKYSPKNEDECSRFSVCLFDDWHGLVLQNHQISFLGNSLRVTIGLTTAHVVSSFARVRRLQETGVESKAHFLWLWQGLLSDAFWTLSG